MDILKDGLAALALAVATPAEANAVARWQPFVAEASVRFGIPEQWINSVMRAESAGRTERYGRPIRSRAGAMGLMQLMPATWAAMRNRYGLGRDPDDPRDNILAGTAYLREMYDRFGHPGLFAAYNAGPGRYVDHLATGRRLPSETVAYLAAVTGPLVRSAAATDTITQALFVVRRTPNSEATAAISNVAPEGILFVIRKSGQ